MTKIIIGIVAAIVVLGCAWGAGYSTRDAQAKAEWLAARAAFEKRITDANKATEVEKERLAGELKQSEEQIDQWKKEYQDALEKSNDTACVLSDADMRRLWDNPGASRPKSKSKRRMQKAARPVSAP